MRNYYIFIIGLISFVCILVIAGFSTVGTPFDQQAANLDKQRLENFNTISYSIDRYAQKNGSLPQNLSILSDVKSIKDPQTNEEYLYQNSSSSSYSLCTNFSTDTTQEQTNAYSYSVNKTHKKGYDCIPYSVSAYLTKKPTVIPTSVPILTPGTNTQTLSVDERDYQRKNDLNRMQAFINTYKSQNGSFPQTLSQIVGPGYLPSLPMDPLTNITYTYTPNQGRTDYQLCAVFETISQKCINSSTIAWNLK